MSHVGDTSNPTPTGGETPGSNSRTRVTSDYSVVGGRPKKLKFNEHGLPIGDKAKSASRLGQLTRTHIPICYKAWLNVPERFKDTLWHTYKEEYPDVRDSQRTMFMGKANNAWKKLKRKLREHFVGDDVTKWKDKVPEGVKSEDWEKFCDFEGKEYQKELRKRNKAIKDNCERKTTHNTGRDGYARRAEKWEKKHGRGPTRAELWLDTHMRKDGTYAQHDERFAEQIKALLKVFQEKGEEESLDSGSIYEVFEKDSRRGVRCVSSTISRKAMLASAFAREMLTEVNMQRDDCSEKVDKLKEEVEGLKFTLTQFVEDFKNGKFVNVQHDFGGTTSPTTQTPTFETPSSVPPTHLTTQFQSLDLVECKIISYTREILRLGRKAKVGVVIEVHGHYLDLREVQVILDKIFKPNYPVWGGEQAFVKTLEDVDIGGIMYWHDDFLHPL